MNIQGIIEQYIQDNGFDGLCNPGCSCGCLLNDLVPCGEPNVDDCQPGYKGPPGPDGGSWATYLSKDAVKAADRRGKAKP